MTRFVGPPLPPLQVPEMPPGGVGGSVSPGPAVATSRPHRSYWLHIVALFGSSTLSTAPVQQSLTTVITCPSAFCTLLVRVGCDGLQAPKSGMLSTAPS